MKNIHDFKGPKSTTVWVLLFDGKFAGKLIANWSDNRAGTVCSAALCIFAGPLKDKGFDPTNIGKAGGYGYDKLSAAVSQCFRNAKVDRKVLQSGNGETDTELQNWEYTIINVL